MLPFSSIQPVADRVVIKRDKMPERTKEGFLIPVTAKNTKMTGTVLAAGPLATVKPGDRIYFLKKNNLHLETDDGPVIAMPELEVIAVISE